MTSLKDEIRKAERNSAIENSNRYEPWDPSRYTPYISERDIERRKSREELLKQFGQLLFSHISGESDHPLAQEVLAEPQTHWSGPICRVYHRILIGLRRPVFFRIHKLPEPSNYLVKVTCFDAATEGQGIGRDDLRVRISNASKKPSKYYESDVLVPWYWLEGSGSLQRAIEIHWPEICAGIAKAIVAMQTP